MSDTVHYVASACRAYASEKGVGLAVDVAPDLKVSMDSTKIQHVLLNLVKNAIEASPGKQCVKLTAEAWDYGGVRLGVENVGASIPEVALAKLFEPFFTTKPGGTGLGLAITRNIVRAHGGDLILSSNKPGKVCFTIRIARAEGNRQLFVTIVEIPWVGSSSLTMNRICAGFFRRHSSSMATSLQRRSGVVEATSRLTTEDFDAVFTDQKMADGEGLQVL